MWLDDYHFSGCKSSEILRGRVRDPKQNDIAFLLGNIGLLCKK